MPKRQRDKAKSEHHRRGQMEVVVPKDSDPPPPFCSHGPCLLFERYKEGGEVSRFYACSVCRDRKQCTFYWHADQPYNSKQQARLKKEVKSKVTHKSLADQLHKIKKLNDDQRKFCSTCDVLLLPEQAKAHKDGHQVITGINMKQLKMPTTLLSPLLDKHKESQFFCTGATIEFLAQAATALNFDAILCVGMPKLHERLNRSPYNKTVRSFLLDIDNRLSQFWPPLKFARYNMFTHYFYSKLGLGCYRKFLEKSGKILIVVDPPFGGLLEPLAHSLSQMTKDVDAVGKVLNYVVVLPYFMEKRVAVHIPGLHMLDYKVEYENHPDFKSGKGKNGSPIRLFTDIPAKDVELPREQGYRFCEICKSYVAKNNKHCKLCNICPSKDGRPYVHCKKCQRCVKSNYQHCPKCERCHFKNAGCPKVGHCSICGGEGHKRKDCEKQQTNGTVGIPKKKRKKET